MSVPIAAYVAHGEAFRQAIGDQLHRSPRRGPNDIDKRVGDALAVALEAAASHIAGAERQRIRQLSLERDAEYPDYFGNPAKFADLLDAP